jgi:hypothetical protein
VRRLDLHASNLSAEACTHQTQFRRHRITGGHTSELVETIPVTHRFPGPAT